MQNYLRDVRNVFLMAFEGDEPAGFVRGTELDQMRSTRKQMFLYEIEVAEDYRRRGVGRELIRALLDYCTTRGFDEVFVFTDPANVPAVGLYRSTGAVTVYQLRPPPGRLSFEPGGADSPPDPSNDP